MYCDAVPQIRNGYAVSATNVSFGGSAKYSCYSGFNFASAKEFEEIYCTDEGRWTPTPLCKGFTNTLHHHYLSIVLAETCPALPPLENGDRILEFGDGTGYGTVYRFECNSGYRREGAPALLCETSGTWSFAPPTCKSKYHHLYRLMYVFV